MDSARRSNKKALIKAIFALVFELQRISSSIDRICYNVTRRVRNDENGKKQETKDV